MAKKRKTIKDFEGLLYMLPAVILFAIFVFFPILQVVGYSFTDWDGMGAAKFIGLQNYITIFKSPEFYTSLMNNIKFFIFGVPLWTIFPMLIAILMFEEVKGWKFFRVAYFLPSIISTAVIASLFRSFFLYNGAVNSFLAIFGLEPIEWFAKGNIAIGLIIFVINWVGFGSATMIYIAGLANFDKEIFEAAEIDGANWWTKVTQITMPMLKSTIQFVIMLNVMAAFAGVFGYVFMMTGGGPGYSTTVLEYLLYLKAFKLHDFGYSSALSVILSIIVIIITLINNYVTKDKNEKGGSLF